MDNKENWNWDALRDLLLDDDDLTIEELNAELREFGVDMEKLNAEIERLTPLLEARWQQLKKERGMT